MAQQKFRLVTRTGEGKTAFGLIKFEKRENLDRLAAALNKRFPHRQYTVEVVRQTEKESFLELVK
jgi:hypothetical protein